MILLTCGGRSYYDQKTVANTLEKIVGNESLIVHGGAQSQGIHTAVVRARWSHSHTSAGPQRNAAMLQLKPDLCVAFPGGRGTADMVRQCREAGVPVMEVQP